MILLAGENGGVRFEIVKARPARRVAGLFRRKLNAGEPCERAFDGILGVLELEQASSAQTDIGLFIGCDPDAAVIAKLNERVAAKKAKDFAKSDAIRDELAKIGYAIKDVAGGKVEVRKA